MADGLSPRPPGRARGRPFEKGQSGNHAGRRTGRRNQATLAAAALLAGESEALTRKAVELALVGDPSAADIAAAMKAVTSALARGAITPGEAATIAAVVDTFVRAIETSDFDRRLQLVEVSCSNHPGDATSPSSGGHFNL